MVFQFIISIIFIATAVVVGIKLWSAFFENTKKEEEVVEDLGHDENLSQKVLAKRNELHTLMSRKMQLEEDIEVTTDLIGITEEVTKVENELDELERRLFRERALP